MRQRLTDALINARLQDHRSGGVGNPQHKIVGQHQYASVEILENVLEIKIAGFDLTAIGEVALASVGKLFGHGVERLRQHRELVTTFHWLPPRKVAVGDRPGTVRQTRQRLCQTLGKHCRQSQRGEQRQH